MMDIALSTRTLAPHRGQDSRACSLRAGLAFLCPRCVLFCRVFAVSHLVFEVEVFDRISAPIARRPGVGSAGQAPGGRDGGLFAISTRARKVEAEVGVFDFISASIGGRLCADRASAERLGDEGKLWRRLGDWGL